MQRRKFLAVTASTAALKLGRSLNAQTAEAGKPEEIFPGIWRFRFGSPEKITPTSTRRYQPARVALQTLPAERTCPVSVAGHASRKGYLVSIPLAPNELIYGLGLMLQSFMQRGLKLFAACEYRGETTVNFSQSDSEECILKM